MTLTLEEMKANRKRWVEALRSGEYKQARHKLAVDGGYCCLGVLAKLCGVPETSLKSEGALGPFPEVMASVGLRDWAGSWDDDHCLASENDEGASFHQIAALIEKEPKGLFVESVEP